ncbi:amino acid ABC transporter substrate-binding protein [bacterium]|nr:amino acid ABC transporter substrate-binding protein [bacterium]
MKKFDLIVTFLLSFIVFVIFYSFLKKNEKTVDSGVVIVGVNANIPPFAFVKKDKIVGVDVDLMKEISGRIKKQFVLKDMSLKVLEPSVLLGKVQVIFGGISPVVKRRTATFFTDPYLEDDEIIILSKTEAVNFKGISDLEGKRGIACSGYSSSFVFKKKLKKMGINVDGFSKKDVRMVWVRTLAEGLFALKNDLGDFFIVARSVVRRLTRKKKLKGLKIYKLDKKFRGKYSFGVSRLYPELFLEIQEALREMKKDGTLKKIKKRWGFN